MAAEDPKDKDREPLPPAESGLREYIDVRFTIPKLETPADEKKLFDVLVDLPSVRNLSVAKGEVTLEYEPVALTKELLVETISKAGFEVTESKSVPASILTDALSAVAADEAAKPENSPDDNTSSNRTSADGNVSES